MTHPTPYVVGHGPGHVIVLNGWFGHAQGWGALVPHLDTSAFTYAFMEYRGYGARRGSDGPFTMAQIAQDTLALADALGWDRFALIGHSMGGMAIQHVLADAPARVRPWSASHPCRPVACRLTIKAGLFSLRQPRMRTPVAPSST